MPDVIITLKTIDQSSPVVKKSKEEFQGLAPALEDARKGITGFISANAGLIAGVAAVGAAAKSSYDEFIKYSGEVRDLAKVSGTGAVEASKLLQVLDDYQLTAEDVTAATKVLTKNGLTPTIDTLAKLSDQYLQINDAQERNEFIIKNLGRAGLQWVNVLQQGGAALRAQGEEVNKSLILTDEQIKKSEKARLAMDAWSDSIQGLKVSFGSTMGSLVLFADKQEQVGKTTVELMKAQGVMANQGSVLYEKFRDQAEAIYEAQQNADDYTDSLQRNRGAQEDLIKVVEHFKSSNEDVFGTMMDLQKQTDQYNEDVATLNDKMAELTAEQSKYTAGSKGYNDVQKEINDTQKSLDALKKKQEEQTKSMLFGMLQQRAAVGGLSDAEFDFLTEVGVQWGLLDEQTADSAKSISSVMDKMSDAMNDPKAQMKDMLKTLQGLIALNGQTVELNVVTNYSENGDKPPVVGGGNKYWTGGQLGSGWAMVGDSAGGGFVKGLTELISPSGYVFDSKTSENLLKSGMINFRSYAEAGDLQGGGGGVSGGSHGGGDYVSPPKPAPKPKPSKGSGGSSPSGRNDTVDLGTTDIIAPIAAATNSAVQNSVQMQIQQRKLVQTINDGQSKLANKIDELISVMQDDNPRAVGKQVGYELARAS